MGDEAASPLHEAVRSGTAVEPLQALLAEWQVAKRIDEEDEEGHSALALACLLQKYDFVECLLRAGANPDAHVPITGQSGCNGHHASEEVPKATALQWSCLQRDQRLFDLLLRFHPDAFAEVPTYEWRTALGLLVAQGEFGMARQLLEANSEMADLLVNQNPCVLLQTVKGEHVDFLQYLLRFEIDPNLADEDGNTPLHWAARQGCPTATALLLQAGADLYARDGRGRTPHFAALPRHWPVARLLVDDDPRAVRTLRDSSGRSLLHALLLDLVSADALPEDPSLPLDNSQVSSLRDFVHHLHSLRCPIDTGRRLLFGAGELSLFEELAGSADSLTPTLRCVLDLLLAEAEWRPLLLAQLGHYPPDVQRYVQASPPLPPEPPTPSSSSLWTANAPA
eukprot:EG_transcript_13452